MSTKFQPHEKRTKSMTKGQKEHFQLKYTFEISTSKKREKALQEKGVF